MKHELINNILNIMYTKDKPWIKKLSTNMLTGEGETNKKM